MGSGDAKQGPPTEAEFRDAMVAYATAWEDEPSREVLTEGNAAAGVLLAMFRAALNSAPEGLVELAKALMQWWDEQCRRMPEPGDFVPTLRELANLTPQPDPLNAVLCSREDVEADARYLRELRSEVQVLTKQRNEALARAEKAEARLAEMLSALNETDETPHETVLKHIDQLRTEARRSADLVLQLNKAKGGGVELLRRLRKEVDMNDSLTAGEAVNAVLESIDALVAEAQRDDALQADTVCGQGMAAGGGDAVQLPPPDAEDYFGDFLNAKRHAVIGGSDETISYLIGAVAVLVEAEQERRALLEGGRT